MTIYGRSEELVSRCIECDLAEPESLASQGGSAPGLVDGILSICSVAVLEATNSEPYVAVSTVACFLEYQSTGVLLTKWRHPVKDLPVAKQWFKLASMVVVVITA